jgi:protein-tyrosine phosphatase
VILHVCTGNQARSPMAQLLMAAGFREAYGEAAAEVPVLSAGTVGPAGRPIQPLAAAELARRGVDATGFTSRLADDHLIGRARLVLTATRHQRDQLIAAVPVVMRAKTFTWREMAWLLDGARAEELPGGGLGERVTALPAFAIGRRGYLVPPAPETFDVADPMGKGKREYRAASADIETAIATILKVLING